MHIANPKLQGRVIVHLVGCGGTGSQVLTSLARLNKALLALGHEHGLHVIVYDDDNVSMANVGRQLFYTADVGLNKALVLTTRVNAVFGTAWEAVPKRFEKSLLRHSAHLCNIVVGCVDTKASRAAIAEVCRAMSVEYWLDIGNGSSDGQVVLGEPLFHNRPDWHMRLPTVVELFPELLTDLEEDDDTPSCSLAEALEKQELFINAAAAVHAMELLWQLFRYGQIEHSVLFVNLKTGWVNPLPVDPAAWKRFGHKTKRKPPVSKPKVAAKP